MIRTHMRNPIAHTFRILMMLVVFLSIVHFLQTLAREVSTSSLFRPSTTGPSQYQQTNIMFLADGTYHKIQDTVTRKAHGRHERYRQVYDANDGLLWEGLSSGDNPERYLRWASGGHLNHNRRWMTSNYAVRAEFSRILEVLVTSSDTSFLAWRYQRRKRIFVAYDMQGFTVGYLGRNGFVAESSRCQPFDRLVGFQAWVPEGTANRMMLWLTAHGLYQIDFTGQSLQLLFESPEPAITQIRTHGWMSLSPEDRDYVDPNQYRPMIDCETEDGTHHLILREPEATIQCVSLPMDKEKVMRQTQVTATREAIFVAHHEAPRPGPNELWPTQWERILYRLTPQGDLEKAAHATSRLSPRVRIVRGATVFAKVVRMVSPLVYRIANPRWFFSEGIRANAFFAWFATVAPIGIGAWLLSLLCVAVTICHEWNRQASRIRLGAWVVWVGLFNVAGLLTYLALHHTVLIRCVACGKKRTLTQPSCVHCKEGLPRPQPEHAILNPA